MDSIRFAGCPSLQLSVDVLRYNRSPRVIKKIMIVLGIIIVWEQRDSIVPVVESVVTYVVATGSSLIQSV